MPNYFRVIRRKLVGQSFDDWSVGDKWVLFIGALISILFALPSFQTDNGFGYIIAFAGLGVVGFLLLRLNNGWARQYQEIGLRRRHKAILREAKKHQAEDPTWPLYQGGDTNTSPPVDSHEEYKAPITQSVIVVRDEFGNKQRIPVLSHLDPENPCDYIYIRVKGGRFVDNDNEAQALAIHELASIVDRTLLLTELKAGISPVYIRAPHNVHEDYRYYEDRGNPLLTSDDYEILDPTMAALVERLQEDSNQYASMVRAYGMVTDWSLFVITIHRDKKTSRMMANQEVDEDALYNLPVLMLARGLVDRLSSSPVLRYDSVDIVKEHELCILVRQAWDIAGIQGFYETIAQKQRAFDDGLITEEQFAEYLWTEVGCLPRTVRSPDKQYMVADGNFISVMRIEELPEYVYPSVENSMLRLGAADVWLRQASVGVSSSASAERTRIYGKKATSANLFTAFLSWLSIVPDFVENQQDELNEQSQQLRQVALVQRYERYSALVATAHARLFQARVEYISVLKGARYKPEVVELTSLHQDKLLAAILGIQL